MLLQFRLEEVGQLCHVREGLLVLFIVVAVRLKVRRLPWRPLAIRLNLRDLFQWGFDSLSTCYVPLAKQSGLALSIYDLIQEGFL